MKWTSLKMLGNIYFLRVSYVILVGVPILAAYKNTPLNQVFDGVPIILKLGYLSSLLLSMAHMLYQGYCPEIIKRFESPNDLYRSLLEIKALQVQYIPSDHDKFDFSIEHCRQNFDIKNEKTSEIQLVICGFLYYIGGVLFALVILERTITVLGP
jgi:hypothetical protein